MSGAGPSPVVSAPGPARVCLRLLGPFEVRVDETIVEVAGLKQRAVLAMLGLHTDRVVAVADLVSAVWDEGAGDRSEHTLQQHVSTLRKALEPGRESGQEPRVLLTRPPGYVLCDADCDVVEFERAASEAADAASSGRWDDAERACDTALARWHGPALVDLRGLLWFDAVARHLDERWLSVVETRADALLARGRPLEVVGDLEPLVERHPYRERFCAQMMLALYRVGRQTDALALCRRTREVLADELGLEPGPELRRLEQRILEHDPVLEALEAVPAGLHDTYRTGEGRGVASMRLPDGQIVAIAVGSTIIGRDPGAAIRLADSRVSRRHARVDVVDDHYVLFDLASTNGTTVNDRPVDEHVLTDGDRIGLGGVELTFRTHLD